MSDSTEVLAHALLAFVEGAKIYDLGCVMDNQKAQHAGLDKIDDAVRLIDEHGAPGRPLLIPLLKHDDPAVRVKAATFLVDTHRDLAVPVLHDIDENCATRASWTATVALFNIGERSITDG